MVPLGVARGPSSAEFDRFGVLPPIDCKRERGDNGERLLLTTQTTYRRALARRRRAVAAGARRRRRRRRLLLLGDEKRLQLLEDLRRHLAGRDVLLQLRDLRGRQRACVGDGGHRGGDGGGGGRLARRCGAVGACRRRRGGRGGADAVRLILAEMLIDGVEHGGRQDRLAVAHELLDLLLLRGREVLEVRRELLLLRGREVLQLREQRGGRLRVGCRAAVGGHALAKLRRRCRSDARGGREALLLLQLLLSRLQVASRVCERAASRGVARPPPPTAATAAAWRCASCATIGSTGGRGQSQQLMTAACSGMRVAWMPMVRSGSRLHCLKCVSRWPLYWKSSSQIGH